VFFTGVLDLEGLPTQIECPKQKNNHYYLTRKIKDTLAKVKSKIKLDIIQRTN